MSDLMLYGVLRMPYEMAMGDELSRYQFYQRAQEAATRLEKAESTAAALSQKAEAPGWQPIETAPKDGTMYLATDGLHIQEENCPGDCYYPGLWEWSASRLSWRGGARGDGFEPTHWMPPPPAPKDTP